MDLVPGYYYHIYNRGNNTQKIFFTRENYVFFLKKMKGQLSPYASIIAWCLMPNHFHWVIYVHKEIMEKQKNGDPLTLNEGITSSIMAKRTINQSIGILLGSYAKAIQKQEGIAGPLFQKHTKAKPLIDGIKIEPAYWKTAFGARINISEGKSYLETCVEYVHLNPVYGGIVKKADDWEFSSYLDYLGRRKGELINYQLVQEQRLFPSESRLPGLSRETANCVIIGIGSNIEAEKNIPGVLEILEHKVKVIKVSSFVKTKPVGIENQPDFTNGAVKIETSLNRKELKEVLKSIENFMGRDRMQPTFGPRCIDLDIVVWNGEIVDADYYTRDFLKNSVREIL